MSFKEGGCIRLFLLFVKLQYYFIGAGSGADPELRICSFLFMQLLFYWFKTSLD